MENNEIFGSFTVSSEEETKALAQRVASGFSGTETICLFGDLGVGKTIFTKGLCEKLGVNDYVNSPTFTIVNEYSAPNGKVYHFDLYRIEDESELYEIGFDEYLQGGVCIIEWAENGQDALPQNRIDVLIERTFLADDERKIQIIRRK